MTYESIKYLHVACALATACLLLLRLLMAALGTDYRTVGPLRWIPHVIDTALLIAAVILAWWSAQYPFVQPWLTAKVLALPFYIIAAAIALNPARPSQLRVWAAGVACLLLGYIVSVAVTRSPWPLPV